MQESMIKIPLKFIPQMTLLWEWFGIREGFCVVATDFKDWTLKGRKDQ